MKYSLIAAAAAFAALMSACGDNGSSSTDDVNDRAEETFTTPGTYTMDKKQQLLIMTKDVGNRDVCNYEDGKYSWGPSKATAKPDSFQYKFIGDTLVLFSFYDGEPFDYGEVYVGGKAGNIEGTWENTYCEYMAYSDEIECYSSEYEKSSLQFSDGKFAETNVRYFGDYLSNLHQTSFVDNYINEIYEALVGWYPGTQFTGIFSSNGNDDTESTIDRYGIKVLENTDSSQTFKVRKKTYTFKVNQAEMSLSSTGYTLMDVNMEVSDGETTCVGEYHLKEVEKEQCSAKYEDDYLVGYDPSEGEFKDRTIYLIENADEFDECLMGIAEDLPERDPDYNDPKE